MSDSGTINITINGRPIQAKAGQTVLQAATAAGIDIPALCNHPTLHAAGACRVCLVEIEKQRTLQPSCTFPVTEGMVVQTDSEKVIAARRFSLQMLFSERSHYCMFCPMSGSEASTDCELQKLAYQLGLDCFAYPPDYARKWPVDATRPFFVMDHSRCILCRRCVRACAEIAANHTLGVHQRGTRTMVCADDDVPFGYSSCVGCGTCLQVCPTGALTDRRSAYLGHETDAKRTRTTCLGCAIGCGIEALTRDNVVLRIDGDWEAGNAGLLCVAGRFESIESGPARITTPLIREGEDLVPVAWDKAIEVVAGRLKDAGAVAGLVSPRLTNETLVAFGCFFNEVLRSDEVALLYGEVPPLELGAPATLADVASADCIIVVGGNPLRQQRVAGYLIKRAFDRDARLIVVDDTDTDLDHLAEQRMRLDAIAHNGSSPFAMLRYTYHLRQDGISQIRTAAGVAQRPVVLYGPNLSTAVYAALRGLPERVRFLPLVEGSNAVGAARFGLSARNVQGDVLYVMAGDEIPNGHDLPRSAFTVLQSAYRTRWTETADVVLPARTWTEKKGGVVNVEGQERPVVPLTDPPKGIPADWETLAQLAGVLGNSSLYRAMADVQASL